ncbi:MAG: hydantoinase/oxoprolinase N-terminal domain-containing protein, partial [Candidatus Pacebacteria bacterium]|nr:hydantoinase/oxoprolinase N-terminal domain-containing protein [Candidatus Paceibacterota bacterium]
MTKNGKRYVIGIDTGGTFTDSVAIDEIGRMWRAKALSQPLEFEKGIIASLERLAENIGIQAG